MPKPPRPWIVSRHDPIEIIDDNLWSVQGDVPDFPKGSGMGRRMCILKLGDGRLVFHNAIPLDEASLAKIREWGTPAILIAPIHLHLIDAPAFAAKLGLQTFASKTHIAEVRVQIPDARPLEELPANEALQWELIPGTRFGEPVFTVKSGPRVSLLFCDAVQNSRPGSGFGGFMFRLLGFTGHGLKAPPFFKKRAVTDKGAVRKVLLRLAQTPGLTRLVPSHGLIVAEDAGAALKAMAERDF